MYIGEKSIRNTLSTLCQHPANLTDDMYTNLQMKLVGGYPELADVLNCCTLLYGRDAPFPVGISNFILAITRGTPIRAIFPPPPLMAFKSHARRLCKVTVSRNIHLTCFFYNRINALYYLDCLQKLMTKP